MIYNRERPRKGEPGCLVRYRAWPLRGNERGVNRRRGPFLEYRWVGFSRRTRGSDTGEMLQRDEPSQRPYGRATHQRRSIIQQYRSRRSQRDIAGVADRDEDITHEPIAADALDRRLPE